jgi:hypothetical protein
LLKASLPSARGGMPAFRLFRHQARPWRCGAGFNCEMSLRARCPLFFSREKRAGAPLRGGAGRGSTPKYCYELDIRFFRDVKLKKSQKNNARPGRLRRLLVGGFPPRFFLSLQKCANPPSVSAKSAPDFLEAGADVIVAGGAVFGGEDPSVAINALRGA